MVVLTLIGMGFVFAVKEMWAAMALCFIAAFIIQLLVSMKD